MNRKLPLIISASRPPTSETTTKAEFSAYVGALILAGRAGGLSDEAMRTELEDLAGALRFGT